MTEGLLGATLTIGGLASFVALWLRALALGRPKASRLAVAAARVVILPAAALILRDGFGVDLPAGLPLLLGAAGLVLAVAPLRGTVRGPTPARGVDVPVAAIALLGLLAVGFVAGGYAHRFHRVEREEEAAARSAPESPAFVDEKPRALDLGAGVVAPGPWRNATVELSGTLEEGAILQVRLRARNPAWALGVSFFLSADPRFESGFVEETKVAFTRLSPGAGTVPPGSPVALRIEARGETFVASVDGRVVARASTRRFARGAVMVLAAHGAATVEGVRVAPAAGEEPPPSRVSDRTSGAARAAAGVGAFALAAAVLIPLGVVRVLALTALGAAPVLLFLARSRPDAPLDAVALALHLFVSCVLLLVVPMVHRDRVSGIRYSAFVLLVVSAATATFLAVRPRAWPAGFEEENALSVVDWEGRRQEADLLHLTHPALRRWNHYLGDHTLRLLKHRREKTPGKPRVAAIGTSSTHGYWLKLPYAYRLHLLLEAAGQPVETLIAAVPGSTGPRLYWFARNVVLRYRPDVVTLSLTFNDSYALTQMDEREYLARITAPDYARGPLDRVRDRLAVLGGGWFLRSCLREFAETGRVTLREGAPDPPARFEAMLEDFAELCAAHGSALVLVKEPVAGGGDRLWKEEFYAAIDRVAARRGLHVVDPTPHLNAHGGAALFMDQVHPLADGAERIAEAMLPAVEAALGGTER